MSAFLAALASSALAETVVKLAMEFLRAYWQRTDLETKVRLEMANEMLTLAARASEWKAAVAARADGGGDLRVQPDAGTVPLPSDHPDASPGAR